MTTSSGSLAKATFNDFPATTDYSVTWKETYTNRGRDGMLLRGTGINPTFGTANGYYFQITDTDTMVIYNFHASGFSVVSSMNVLSQGANVDRWYRATVQGDNLIFEYSVNGVDFVTAITATDTTHTIPGITQYFRGAYGPPITGAFIDDITFRIPTPPDAPTDLSATAANASLVLNWTAPADNGQAVTDYIIEYKVATDTSWETFADDISTDTTATITGLTNGTLYDTRVRAVNAGGSSPASVTVSATLATTPDVPTMTATPLPTAITLSWDSANNGGATPVVYSLQMKRSTQDDSFWTTIVDSEEITSFTATGLTMATAYDLRVNATNSAGTSAYSDVTTVTTGDVEVVIRIENEILIGGEIIPSLPTFIGRANPGSEITVTVFSDPVICTTVADSIGNWSCTMPTNLPAGYHTVIVTVRYDDTTTEYGPYTVRVLGDEEAILSGDTETTPQLESPRTGLQTENKDLV